MVCEVKFGVKILPVYSPLKGQVRSKNKLRSNERA